MNSLCFERLESRTLLGTTIDGLLGVAFDPAQSLILEVDLDTKLDKSGFINTFDNTTVDGHTFVISKRRPAPSGSGEYLFSFHVENFKPNPPGNNQSMYLFNSADGQSLNSLTGHVPAYVPFAHPPVGAAGTMRDPAISRIGGKYYVPYNVISLDDASAQTRHFGLISSHNLNNWSASTQRFVNTDPDGSLGIKGVWAPRFFQDNDTVYAVFTARTTAEPYTNQSYLMPALNSDLTSWGPAQLLEFNGPGANTYILDPFIVKKDGLYHVWVTPFPGYIQYGTSTSIFGPYANETSGDWMGIGSVSESPFLVERSPGVWRIYWQHYGNGGPANDGIYYSESSTWETWSTPTQLTFYNFPFHVAHPTVIFTPGVH